MSVTTVIQPNKAHHKRCEGCGRFMSGHGFYCSECLEKFEADTVTQLVRQWTADVSDSIRTEDL
jgi:tRNA(Ile2) C34 agmatinyltransferase TiaS